MKRFLIDTRSAKVMQRIRHELKNMPKGRYEITVKTKGDQPSSEKSHAYYFGQILAPLCQETGYTKEELHTMFMEKFTAKAVEVKGQVVFVRKSLKELTKRQFSEYIAQIKMFALEFFPDVKLPE